MIFKQILLGITVSAQLSVLIDSALSFQGSGSEVNWNDFLEVSSFARLSTNDADLLNSLQSVHEMDLNLRTYLDASSFELPYTLARATSRINYLASKLYETAASASSIYGDPDVTLWANECLIMGSDGIEETLFSLDLLYDNLVGSVGEDLGDSDSPATDLNGFILYMRTLQLKGHLVWSIAIDITTQDAAQTVVPIQKYTERTDAQALLFDDTSFYDTIGGGPLVAIRSVIYQSYIRISNDGHSDVNTQAYASDWEHVNLEPQGSNVFKMKTFHNTYLQAISGDDMNVTQSYDSSAAGCLWTVQKLDNSMTRNYFGAVTGIKTVHGTLWAEGRTRSGSSVLTTSLRVSDLTQFTIAQVGVTDNAYILSPSGLYLTSEPLTGKLTLELNPAENSIFEVEALDDEFFAIKSLSGSYARSAPGALAKVDSLSTSVGDWNKLARVDAPTSVYNIISEYGTYMVATGPPIEEDWGKMSPPVQTTTGDGSSIEGKWEMISTWEDIDSLFT